MRNLLFAIITIITLIACNNSKRIFSMTNETAFFGDSTAVINATNKINGYDVSFLHQHNGIILMHFQRGDTIDQYIAVHELPFDLRHYEDSIGVFNVDFEIPVMKLDSLSKGPDFMLMDINFDGEEDLLIRHQGYNRSYYACFDLTNGNPNSSCPGLLECLHEPPYNNIMAGGFEETGDAETIIDYKNETITILEQSGCCAHTTTIAKKVKIDDFWTKIAVVKNIDRSYSADGCSVTISERDKSSDSLKVVKQYFEPYQ